MRRPIIHQFSHGPRTSYLVADPQQGCCVIIDPLETSSNYLHELNRTIALNQYRPRWIVVTHRHGELLGVASCVAKTFLCAEILCLAPEDDELSCRRLKNSMGCNSLQMPRHVRHLGPGQKVSLGAVHGRTMLVPAGLYSQQKNTTKADLAPELVTDSLVGLVFEQRLFCAGQVIAPDSALAC